MYIHSLLRYFLRVILPLSFLSTLYLYLYPAFHGCAFPSTDGLPSTAFRHTFAQHLPFQSKKNEHEPSLAPFRLLVLADPQLEGDSSLPAAEEGFIFRLKEHWIKIRGIGALDQYPVAVEVGREIISEDIPRALNTFRKQIDLFGNDYYLAHIYRTLSWWSEPSHVTVLGDLIGSQWVSDDEFEWRGWRFWNRVFAGGRRVDESISTCSEDKKEGNIFQLGDQGWKTRIINIAGNHDIGYAGDISQSRMERFERVFGKANWDVRFEYPRNVNSTSEMTQMPSLHLVVLNSLNLDTPALSEELQSETYSYLNSILSSRARPVEDRTSFSLLLTHLPLYKRSGICVDGPMFDFWDSDDGGGAYRPNGLKEQNHLSQHSSQPGTLEAMFGMHGDTDQPAHGKGRNGLILNGHDHEGCDVWHFIPSKGTWSHSARQDQDEKKTQWDAVRWKEADLTSAHTGIREVTLRSMMGEFGGNAGLLSAWFDFDIGEWKYEIQTCQLGVQHIWWAIHILDIVAVMLLPFTGVLNLFLPHRKSHSSKSKPTTQSPTTDKKQ